MAGDDEEQETQSPLKAPSSMPREDDEEKGTNRRLDMDLDEGDRQATRKRKSSKEPV